MFIENQLRKSKGAFDEKFPNPKDKLKFYYIARGSLRETQSLLHLLGKSELPAHADKCLFA